MPARRCSGITLVEVLVVLVVVVLALALLMPLLLIDGHPHSACRAKCAANLRQLISGAIRYVHDHAGYLPTAWHTGGAVADDLSNLTYWRRELTAAYPAHDPGASTREALGRYHAPAGSRDRPEDYVTELWTCPADGRQRDYFASHLVFHLPDDPAAALDKTTHIDELTASVSSSWRPALSEVNASLPDPKARDRDDPGHQAEMRSGFSIRRIGDVTVFVGVGRSLRDLSDPTTSRLDLRHGDRANVAYLDGHVGTVGQERSEDHLLFHRRWNTLTLPANDE